MVKNYASQTSPLQKRIRSIFLKKGSLAIFETMRYRWNRKRRFISIGMWVCNVNCVCTCIPHFCIGCTLHLVYKTRIAQLINISKHWIYMVASGGKVMRRQHEHCFPLTNNNNNNNNKKSIIKMWLILVPWIELFVYICLCPIILIVHSMSTIHNEQDTKHNSNEEHKKNKKKMTTTME